MPELIDTVRQLLALNRIDLVRYELQTEIEQTPRRLAALADELTERQSERSLQESTSSDAAAALRAGEESLAKMEKRRERAQQRIPMLKTSDQVAATQREIEAIGQDVDGLEIELLEQMEGLEQLKARLADAQRAAEDTKAALEDGGKAWEVRSPVALAEMEKLDAERAPLAGDLRSDFLRRYQLAWRQRGKINPTGVTTVQGRICDTCNTEVSARWLQESRDYVALHSCQSCKRLLLFDPDAPSRSRDPEEEPISPQ
jgi:predicted  nucleic acid-binding Zn-ribbon protein